MEEELLLADPRNGDQLNAGEKVLGELVQPGRGEVKGEIHACQVELITDVCANVADAIGVLRGLRRAVLDTGVALIGSGTHPSAEEGEAEITDKERYQLISDLLGDAVATPVSALHVHVGMPDAETAIRVFNGLRHHLPLLEALAANSPFRHGRDTGLASAREITLRGWPRSGAPREMRDYEDFTDSTALLTQVADVPDYTFHWWKLRPHPRLGTVEIRALDVQASLAHTASLVAAVHSLALHEAKAEPVPGPPAEILEEASFRAARGGVDATLPDAGGSLRPARDLLAETLERLRKPKHGPHDFAGGSPTPRGRHEMIDGVHMTLFSTDAGAARAFFAHALALDSVDAGGGWPIFGLPPAELAVHPTEGEPRHELFLMCPDLGAATRSLESRGVRLAAGVTEEGFGLMTRVEVPGLGSLGLYEPRHPRPPS